uniref:Uncharacterized protein n=1 Tax=Knipowitschia caucasica TaxID=637954 RepID=A0AAV2MIL2_KNICA
MTVESNVLVLSKVRHSQMLNAAPLRPWIIANKDGTIEAAHCDCKAGLESVVSLFNSGHPRNFLMSRDHQLQTDLKYCTTCIA